MKSRKTYTRGLDDGPVQAGADRPGAKTTIRDVDLKALHLGVDTSPEAEAALVKKLPRQLFNEWGLGP